MFYSFLWFQIITGIIAVLKLHNVNVDGTDDTDAGPNSSDTNNNNNNNPLCHFDNLGPYGRLLAMTYLRQENLFLVSFLIYGVYPHGTKISNIAFVTTIFAIHIYLFFQGGLREDVDVLLEHDDGPKSCDKEYIIKEAKFMNYISIAWPLIALGLAIIEYDFALNNAATAATTRNSNNSSSNRKSSYRDKVDSYDDDDYEDDEKPETDNNNEEEIELETNPLRMEDGGGDGDGGDII